MNLKRIKKDQLGKLIKKYRCDSFVIIVIFFKSNKNYLRIDHIAFGYGYSFKTFWYYNNRIKSIKCQSMHALFAKLSSSVAPTTDKLQRSGFSLFVNLVPRMENLRIMSRRLMNLVIMWSSRKSSMIKWKWTFNRALRHWSNRRPYSSAKDIWTILRISLRINLK